MKKIFYSNGKLLITGEYLVLDGAKALALPTKFGQNLIVETANDKKIYWKSFDSDGTIWFETEILFTSIISKNNDENNNPIQNTLIEILHEAYNLNPKFLNEAEGYTISTELTFPKFWGLGTSSTLINNIAQWLEIDAFSLLKNSFGGSGYDLACAQNNSALTYQLVDNKPIVNKVLFNPNFSNSIYFVYLNKKQSSKLAILNYYSKRGNVTNSINIISEITESIIHSTTIDNFEKLVREHEAELSSILEQKTIQEVLFSDFNGTIKSLGAWGGDFVMATSKENPTEYFNSKGFLTVISYDDMIL